MANSQTDFPKGKVAGFCSRNHIRKLSLFGSLHRGKGRADSHVDLLVGFDPDRIPGLIRLAGMEIELTRLQGRKADLRTPEDLRSLTTELERVIEPEE